MPDEFSCNSCGASSDTGYFYCEKCHKKHKEKEKEKQSTLTDQKRSEQPSM